MSKRVSLFLLPVLALAACGGGGDDSGAGADGDWCALAQRIEDSSERYDDAFDEGGATLGDALGEFTTLLDDARDSAPEMPAPTIPTKRSLLDFTVWGFRQAV